MLHLPLPKPDWLVLAPPWLELAPSWLVPAPSWPDLAPVWTNTEKKRRTTLWGRGRNSCLFRRWYAAKHCHYYNYISGCCQQEMTSFSGPLLCPSMQLLNTVVVLLPDDDCKCRNTLCTCWYCHQPTSSYTACSAYSWPCSFFAHSCWQHKSNWCFKPGATENNGHSLAA